MSENQTAFSFGGPPPSPPPPSGIRLEVDEEGLGWILFDLPGEKVNKLTTPLMESLRDLLDEAGRRNVKGLVFASDKPDMFIAGADVEEIGGVTDPRIGMEKAAYGQAVFETIARFGRPTVAVITGPCLGGGLELALACTWRVAEKTAAVKLGLPEVKLGIIPGFGGTQRLPRRTGLPVALDLILSGKTVPARPARKRGLIDLLVPPGEGRRVAAELLLGLREAAPHTPGRRDRWMGSFAPLRRFVLTKAEKALESKARREHYPAPYLALEAIGAGFGMAEVAAYRLEARLLGEAIVTPASKNLVWLFQSSGEAKSPPGLDLEAARHPQRLAVLGAGVMGGGIAGLAAESDYPIRIKDIAFPALEGALEAAGSQWHRQVRRRRLTPRERDRRLERLSFTLDYTGFRNVDFVFEAVVENLDIKHKVLAEVEREVAEETVIASNTSSLRIADIASETRHPERVVGLHFFNPVHRMPLVEVVAGPKSAEWAVATAYRLALRLGKTPILVRDEPGFLVNRLLAFYLGEALHLLERGADPVRVDRLLTEFGMPMGPFELLDQIGIDVAEKVTHTMSEAYGERLSQQATLGRLVGEGHLGRKSGQGFYLYPEGKKGRFAPAAREAAGNPASWNPSDDTVVDRLVLPMVNEAARCLEEGAVGRPLDVDLGMVMGTGFPPFRGGLLRYADARGVQAVADRLRALAELGEPRFHPSEALLARTGGFY